MVALLERNYSTVPQYPPLTLEAERTQTCRGPLPVLWALSSVLTRVPFTTQLAPLPTQPAFTVTDEIVGGPPGTSAYKQTNDILTEICNNKL